MGPRGGRLDESAIRNVTWNDVRDEMGDRSGRLGGPSSDKVSESPSHSVTSLSCSSPRPL